MVRRYGPMLIFVALLSGGVEAGETTGVIEVRAVQHDGSPVAGRFVRIRSRGKPRFAQELLLDQNGRLRVEALQPGRYEVHLLDATGSRPAVLRHSGAGYSPAEKEIDLRAGETRVLQFRLPHGGQVEILVPDVSATPKELRYAFSLREWRDEVAAWVPLPCQPRAKHVTTRSKQGPGKDGHVFELADVPPGRYSLSVYRKGYRRLSVKDFPVLAGITTNVAVPRFKKGLSLTLAYRGPFLKSEYAGTEPVQVSYWGPRRELCSNVQHGQFDPKTPKETLSGLVPGSHVVLLRSHDYVTFVDLPSKAKGALELKPPASLKRSPQGHQVRVRLTRKGKPIGRMFCALLPHDPKTERGPRPGRWGWFRSFKGIPDGRYELLVFDGVYGTTCGFDPSPRSTLVKVEGKDVVVTMSLDDATPKASSGK